MKPKLMEYQELELISTPKPATKTNKWNLSTKLSQIWQFLMTVLNQKSEVQIYQIYEGGINWWYAYDPATGEAVYLESETDVELWLEQLL